MMGLALHERGGLVFADRDGRLVSVKDVLRGRRCECVCPNDLCRAPLISRQGKKVAWHFAHDKRPNCKVGLETALHKMAKDILAESRELRVPAYWDKVGNVPTKIYDEQVFTFDRVELECRTGRIVPDVILYKADRALIVELVVTHWCDQTKVDKLKLGNFACLEIDLTKYNRVPTRDYLRDIVIHEARRKWLNNPNGARKAQEKTDEEKRLAAEQAEKLRLKAQPFITAIQKVRAIPRKKVTAAVSGRLDALSLKSFIGLDVKGDNCFLHRELWQLAVLSECVIRSIDDFEFGRFTTKIAFELAKRFLAPGWPNWIPEDLRTVIASAVPNYQTPYEVVRAYLERLEMADIVQRVGSEWEASCDFTRKVTSQDQQESERVVRHETIKNMVRAILKAVPAAQRRGFSYEAWLKTDLTSWMTIEDTINEHPEEEWDKYGKAQTAEYRALHARVSALYRMVAKDGPIVDDAAYLPIGTLARDLASERERRAAEAVKQRSEEENARRLALEKQAIDKADSERRAADERSARFEAYVRDVYPSTRAGEVIARLQVGGHLAAQTARASESGLATVLNHVGIVSGSVQPSAATKKHLVRWHGVLGQVIPKTYDRSWQFLKTWNPVYGCSPIDACVDFEAYEAIKMVAFHAKF